MLNDVLFAGKNLFCMSSWRRTGTFFSSIRAMRPYDSCATCTVGTRGAPVTRDAPLFVPMSPPTCVASPNSSAATPWFSSQRIVVVSPTLSPPRPPPNPPRPPRPEAAAAAESRANWRWHTGERSGAAPPRPAPRPPRPPPPGCAASITASAESVSRLAVGSNAFTGWLRGGAVRMKAFLSFPAYCWRSSSVHPAWTSIAGPDTAPTVPADQACGTASTMNGTGAVAIIEKCSFSQPRPAGLSQVSSCTFARPHDFICDIAQAPARVAFGDQVSRGPYTSDNQ